MGRANDILRNKKNKPSEVTEEELKILKDAYPALGHDNKKHADLIFKHFKDKENTYYQEKDLTHKKNIEQIAKESNEIAKKARRDAWLIGIAACIISLIALFCNE